MRAQEHRGKHFHVVDLKVDYEGGKRVRGGGHQNWFPFMLSSDSEAVESVLSP